MNDTTYLRKTTIIPDIAFVRKTVAYKAKFALFHILFQRIECFSSSYLSYHVRTWVPYAHYSILYLYFGVGPPWDLDYHVVQCLFLVGIQWNIMKR